jgi:TatD DNase family protein
VNYRFSDTHSHLYLPEFASDIDAIVGRALDAGVHRILLPNVDIDTIAPMLRLAEKFPQCMYPMLGLHPCSVKENYHSHLDVLQRMLFTDTQKVLAIGEIGLDFYWNTSFQKEQEEVFRLQLQWAKALQLPVVIHIRASFDEALSIVEEENDKTLRGVFHCFTGTRAQAERIIALKGFMVGIGGVLTFKNSTLSEVMPHIPAHMLLLETDSPYLAPVPYRGKRNESAYIPIVAQKVADILGCEMAEISIITERNTDVLFF